MRLVLGLGLIGAAVLVFWALSATRPQPGRVEAAAAPVPVRAVRVEAVPVGREWEGFGTVRAMKAADISAQVSARVIERPAEVEAGAAVRRGDLLLRLDPTDFRQMVAAGEHVVAQLRADLEAWEVQRAGSSQRLELAQEEVALLRADHERVVAALERGAGTVSEVEQRLAALRRAQRELAQLQEQLEVMPARRARLAAQIGAEEAGLALARENLARTTITAPISGALQWVEGQVGELLAVGAPVARIVDLSRLEVPLRVGVSARMWIVVGDPVELEPETRDGAVWRGAVARIAPETDPQTRAMTVFVEAAQAPQAAAGAVLLPGQFVRGRISTGHDEARLVVPRRAVDAERVLLVSREGDEQRVRRAQVRVSRYIEGRFPTIDPEETQWAVVEGGLRPGDVVVTSNLDTLVPGVAVRARLARADEGTALGGPAAAADPVLGARGEAGKLR